MRSEPKEEFEKRLATWIEAGSQGEKPKRKRAKYVKHKARKLTLEQFKEFAAGMNMLSMFQVRWQFGEGPCRELSKAEETAIFGQNHKTPEDRMEEARKAKGYRVPLYPLFYRCNGTRHFPQGTILYPARGEDATTAMNFSPHDTRTSCRPA